MWILVDCLNYQGLCHAQGRHAGPPPDRDEPITSRMETAHCIKFRHFAVINVDVLQAAIHYGMSINQAG